MIHVHVHYMLIMLQPPFRDMNVNTHNNHYSLLCMHTNVNVIVPLNLARLEMYNLLLIYRRLGLISVPF